MNSYEQTDLAQQQTVKQLIRLYRKTAAKLLKLKNKGVCGYISLQFCNDDKTSVFEITVFNGAHDNRSFHFYEFGRMDVYTKLCDAVVSAIKCGDFNEIIKLSDHRTEEAV